MLRIHFTTDDLGRVRIAGRPDPLWEILLSLHLVRQGDGELVFGQWRASVWERLDPTARLLFDLAPSRGYSPDFLTPTRGAELDRGIDAVMSTGRARLRDDLARLAAEQRPSPWVRMLADGHATAMRRLGEALRSYHALALAPYWHHIRAHIQADRARRAQVLLDDGLEGLLADLHPSMRWTGSVLSFPYGPLDRDLYLGGRGLLLLPSFFCWGKPICLKDPALPQVLVYPIDHEPGWATRSDRPDDGSRRSLAALLGRTRAAALETIAAGCTTGELAGKLRVSAASASEHATTLREAGLITTRRGHRAAHHSLTTLGALLLREYPARSRDCPSAVVSTRTGTEGKWASLGTPETPRTGRLRR